MLYEFIDADRDGVFCYSRKIIEEYYDEIPPVYFENVNDMIDCLLERGSLNVGFYVDSRFGQVDDDNMTAYGMIDIENDFDQLISHDAVATGLEIDPKTGEVVNLLIKDGNSPNSVAGSRNAVPIDISMHPEIANMTSIPPEYRDKYKSIPQPPMIYKYVLYEGPFLKEWRKRQKQNPMSTMNEKQFMNTRQFAVTMWFGGVGGRDTIGNGSRPYCVSTYYGGSYIDYDYIPIESIQDESILIENKRKSIVKRVKQKEDSTLIDDSVPEPQF